MNDEINRQMEEAQQGIFRLRKIDAMIGSLQKEQQNLTKKISEFKDILDKEDLDVEKLQHKNLAHLFYSVLANLEERVEKEQREALAAQLKYDQAVRDLENIKSEISKFTLERSEYNACENEYNRLYAEKKETLLKSNEEIAVQILDLTEQLTNSKNNIKEIGEALAAGQSIISSLETAQNSLDSAEGWGTWDLFGGGLITDLIKHSHIDDAKSQVEKTQSLLLHFKTELADVRIESDIHIETDGFSKFADFFFDGLIADWFMQSKIHDSQDSVNQVKEQVQDVINKLGSLERNEIYIIEKTEKELDELITNA